MLIHSNKRYKRLISITAFVLLLHGCSNFSALSDFGEIAVDSEPSGASVFMMGKRLGSTPLVVRHQDVFPVVYAPDHQDLYGLVIMKKDGCQDYLQRVNSRILKEGIKAELDCSDIATNQSPGQIPHANQPSRLVPVPTSIKNRLIRLEVLHQEGLITNEEYDTARRQILDEL